MWLWGFCARVLFLALSFHLFTPIAFGKATAGICQPRFREFVRRSSRRLEPAAVLEIPADPALILPA